MTDVILHMQQHLPVPLVGSRSLSSEWNNLQPCASKRRRWTAGFFVGVARSCRSGCWETPIVAGSGLGSQEGTSCASLSCSAQGASARRPLLLMHQLMAIGARSIGSVLGAAKSCMEPPAARQAATLLLCISRHTYVRAGASWLRNASQL